MRKVFLSMIYFCPSFWEKEHCVEKRLWEFEAQAENLWPFWGKKIFACDEKQYLHSFFNKGVWKKCVVKGHRKLETSRKIKKSAHSLPSKSLWELGSVNQKDLISVTFLFLGFLIYSQVLNWRQETSCDHSKYFFPFLLYLCFKDIRLYLTLKIFKWP